MILSSDWLILMLQDMYMLRRGFFIYKEVDGKNLYMENSLTSNILAFKKFILNIIFGKLLTLNNVLHDIIKNLVSGLLLSINSFKMMFKSDKFILSKSYMFIEKGY